ncbi:MAG TPA: AcvB/VirJ family lysyl-phosphatidylglycerol hydrolase [Spirochaetota bacterium]|nr:AcvB/VirJ family lysyl-phosphatidylglycerol hydrolase [Spirochaetota bacterium]HPS87051.1 AcvB/VirJ family lysyl-phosphatidylglycerol hydrolase [Spirochaetota bacterium]
MRIYALPFILVIMICCVAVIAEVTSVIEIPAETGGDTIAIFISGDGGWRKIDRDISAVMASQGIHIIGINSVRYFWKKRTPEETANDISSLISSYINKTKRKKVILIGYSFGADVLPFIINRIPEKTRLNLSGAVMLGISESAIFEISAGEWLGKTKGEYATLPEVLKINGIPLLFIEGSNDDHTVIQKLDRKKNEVVLVDGGHHFDGDYNRLAWIIINWNKKNNLYK